ncbi:MAG: transcription-repair coupling factor [Sulfobacillus sp.]
MRQADPQPLLPAVAGWAEVDEIGRALGGGPTHQTLVGLSGSALRLVSGALCQGKAQPVLVIVPGESQAEEARLDLEAMGVQRVVIFPPHPVLPYEVLAESRHAQDRRLGVLRRLAANEDVVVVACLEAVVGRMMPFSIWREQLIQAAVGDHFDLRGLVERLVTLGYERVGRAEATGHLAVRGGIVDLVDPSDQPIRLEFDGDRLESIHRFDLASQRSLQACQQVTIAPADEVVVGPAEAQRGMARLRRETSERVGALHASGRPEAAAHLEGRIAHLVDGWQGRPIGRSAARFLPYWYPPSCLIDALPSGALIVLEEADRLAQAAEHLERESAHRAEALLAEGSLLPLQAEALLPYRAMEQAMRTKAVLACQQLFHRAVAGGVQAIDMRSGERYGGRWELVLETITAARRDAEAVLIVAATQDRLEMVRNRLEDADIPVAVADRAFLPQPGTVGAFLGVVSQGFYLPAHRLRVVTDQELVGTERRPRRRLPEGAGDAITSPLQLRQGDYVVHVQHGVGHYLGLTAMMAGGVKRDYLIVAYAQGDRLYVPTDQIRLVHRYVGQEGREPKVYRLGGADWERVKSRVKASVQEMAEDLLRQQALRAAAHGLRCGPDTAWQGLLEESFPYEETRDQMRAMEEIRKDLESGRPMDRILLADVGYGKTELAIRAALKVVAEGSQVAVLVPTTILAQQHFQTFSERLAALPVSVDVLSRFRSPAEQRSTLKRLASGQLDLIIGTHRLLGRDVSFHRLGLIVVDEEQRFGVADKERLKALKAGVHVLTLTATPIPRTLQMGFFGLRDISRIDTPPEDRRPVQTVVAEFDPDLVRDAIYRELDRGGQVFYVHNRVESISAALARLLALTPEARIALAHGRMGEGELEETMVAFQSGDADVLLATTIVESGLDIPNVNTLIVEDADRLGLGQMYQLRGRIGRSHRQAFAYFTYRTYRTLSEEAERRLRAMREFTELGAGFQIALRDLEIRGAGNILGPEQHGFMLDVGLDLYSQLLQEAVRALAGDEVAQPVATVIELPVDAFIPDDLVPDGREKVSLYRRLAACDQEDVIDDLGAEIHERFGEPPPPVMALLEVARLRIRAGLLGLKAVRLVGTGVRLEVGARPNLEPQRVVEAQVHFKGRLTVHQGKEPHIALRPLASEGLPLLTEVGSVLRFLIGEIGP